MTAKGLVRIGVDGAIDVVQGLSKGTSIVLKGCQTVLKERLDERLHPYFFLLNADKLADLLADPGATVTMLTDMMNHLTMGVKASWHWDKSTRWNNPLSLAMQGLAEMLVKTHKLQVEDRFLGSMNAFLGVAPEGCEDLTGKAGPPMEECDPDTYTWYPQADPTEPIRYTVTFDETQGERGKFMWYGLSSLAVALNNLPDDARGPSTYASNVLIMANSAQNWVQDEFYSGLARTVDAVKKLSNPERLGSAAASAVANMAGHGASMAYEFGKGAAKQATSDAFDLAQQGVTRFKEAMGVINAEKADLANAQARGYKERAEIIRKKAEEEAKRIEAEMQRNQDGGTENTEARNNWGLFSKETAAAVTGIPGLAGLVYAATKPWGNRDSRGASDGGGGGGLGAGTLESQA